MRKGALIGEELRSLVTQEIPLSAGDYNLNRQADKDGLVLRVNPRANAAGSLNTNISTDEFTNFTGSVNLSGSGANPLAKKKLEQEQQVED